jgi:hypothetical protein
MPGGEKFSFKGKIITGVPITAEITDKSIATIEPAKPKSKTSGYRPGNLMETFSFQDQAKLDSLGEVVFELTTKKVGMTNFYLTAEVPKQWSGSTKKYFGPSGMPVGGPIKVVNCKYRVTITYSMLQSSAGTFGYMSGFLNTFITGDGADYLGTGILKNPRSEIMPPCNFSSDGFQNATTILGELTNGKLDLSIKYEPGQQSATIACPGVGGQTTNNTINPSDWLVTKTTFPETGGTQSFPIDYAHWFGSLTITVAPVNASTP